MELVIDQIYYNTQVSNRAFFLKAIIDNKKYNKVLILERVDKSWCHDIESHFEIVSIQGFNESFVNDLTGFTIKQKNIEIQKQKDFIKEQEVWLNELNADLLSLNKKYLSET